MLTTDHRDEKVEELYEQIEELKKNEKNNEIAIVMSDLMQRLQIIAMGNMPDHLALEKEMFMDSGKENL